MVPARLGGAGREFNPSFNSWWHFIPLLVARPCQAGLAEDACEVETSGPCRHGC